MLHSEQLSPLKDTDLDPDQLPYTPPHGWALLCGQCKFIEANGESPSESYCTKLQKTVSIADYACTDIVVVCEF